MTTRSDVQSAAPLADGRYLLLEVLGEGGMATVYRAMDTRLQVARAIKVLSPSLATRRALRERFEAEARTMAQFDHPNIVRVVDVGIDGDRVYIVMELVAGGSLLERVRDFGALPHRLAVDVTVDVLAAIAAAHEHGVVHRDIKPHNVLVTERGQIRVTDFGIARLVEGDDNDELTRTGAVMGTWGFMAPEQKENAKAVDFRADLYSAGATLWAIITNQTPGHLFAADLDPTMMAGIPEPLVELIKKATRFRREDRFANAAEMLAATLIVREKLDPPPPDTPALAARGLRNLAQMAPSSTLAAGPPPGKGFGAGVTMVPPGATPPPDDDGRAPQVESAAARDNLEQAFENVFGHGSGSSDTLTSPPGGGRRWPWSKGASTGVEVSLDEGETRPVSTRTLIVLIGLSLGVAALAAFGILTLLEKQAEQAEQPSETTPVGSSDRVSTTSPTPQVPPVSPLPTEPTPPAQTEAPPSTTGTTTAQKTSTPVRSTPTRSTPAVPTLSHTPISRAKKGAEVRFKVRISGSKAYETVSLNYRPRGTTMWTNRPMYATDEGMVATLVVSGDLERGFEYFILAKARNSDLPSLGSGSYTAPHAVVVE